jgi:hypothetical protein
MVCHITEGELQVEQDGKTFTAKKNFVWTCNKNTKEQSSNVSNAVARRPPIGHRHQAPSRRGTIANDSPAVTLPHSSRNIRLQVCARGGG